MPHASRPYQGSRDCLWQRASKTSCIVLPWPKKRTILEIRGEKNAVPRVISCSIRRDQRRAKSRGQSRIGLALRWSRLIEHDITRGTAFFSPRISMMVLFFGQGSTLTSYPGQPSFSNEVLNVKFAKSDRYAQDVLEQISNLSWEAVSTFLLCTLYNIWGILLNIWGHFCTGEHITCVSHLLFMCSTVSFLAVSCVFRRTTNKMNNVVRKSISESDNCCTDRQTHCLQKSGPFVIAKNEDPAQNNSLFTLSQKEMNKFINTYFSLSYSSMTSVIYWTLLPFIATVTNAVSPSPPPPLFMPYRFLKWRSFEFYFCWIWNAGWVFAGLTMQANIHEIKKIGRTGGRGGGGVLFLIFICSWGPPLQCTLHSSFTRPLLRPQRSCSTDEQNISSFLLH